MPKRDKYDAMTVTLKACPCCGGTDLEAGHASASSAGVQYMGCGLCVKRQMPDDWPEDIFIEGEAYKRNSRRLLVYTIIGAAEAWNRRTADEPGSAVIVKLPSGR